MYIRHNVSFRKRYGFYLIKSNQYKNITVHRYAVGLSLSNTDRQQICSNYHELKYPWWLILNGQYLQVSINRVSMILSLVTMRIDMIFGRCYA
jgi:hypothetical protein